MAAPTFAPIWRPDPVSARVDPFPKAISAALSDVEPGRLTFAKDERAMRAAITLAPEMPLSEAMGAFLAVQLGFADALGALAPPEVAVHFVWPDRLKVNGALCGSLRAGASTADPADEPEWLVIGIDVPYAAQSAEPGRTWQTTVLAEEGCVDFTVVDLLEAMSRHTLGWINRFLDEGFQPIHRAWNAKCDTLGERVAYPSGGTFLGLDERGGMLLRDDNGTTLIPLTALLDPQWPSSPA